MPTLDTTIVNVALDKLAADLHAPLSAVQGRDRLPAVALGRGMLSYVLLAA
jgi:hypothetical protein